MGTKTKHKLKARVKCPECHSLNVLFRKSSQTFWCRRCGTEFAVKKARRFVRVATV